VINSRAYANERPDLIIMAITSQMKPAAIVGEVIVQDWQAAGLLKPSAIKPVLTTIEKRLVIKCLGQLTGPDQQALRGGLSAILG
jgi:mRNA interferase MazF